MIIIDYIIAGVLFYAAFFSVLFAIWRAEIHEFGKVEYERTKDPLNLKKVALRPLFCTMPLMVTYTVYRVMS